MTEKEKYIFERKPVLGAIFSLAIPSILGQLILVIYNMADTLFVGLTENEVMINAVTICIPAYMVITAISNLFGVGGASVIARSMGKGFEKRARRSSSFAFYGCLILALFYCLLVALLSSSLTDYALPRILGAHGQNETAINASKYILFAICLCGVPTAINSLFSHLIRAQGLSLHASIGIALGGLLNVALDPLFMFVIIKPGNEALGAGIATGISNVVAMLYYVFIFIKLRKKLIVSVHFTPKMFKENIPREVFIIGLPAFLMTLCENISYALLGYNMGLLSNTQVELSGVEVAKKVNMFAHNAVRGMAQGILPLVGYNKSSGNRKRMRKIVLTSGAIALSIALFAATINVLPTGKLLISIFLHGKNNNMMLRQQLGYKFLIIFSIGAPFSAIAYMVISFFQAVGKPWRSMILALLRKGILDIPLMFILNVFIPKDGVGLVLATPIADAICCIVAIIIFTHYIKYHSHNKGSYAINNETLVESNPLS